MDRSDQKFIELAIKEAKQGVVAGDGGPFGAVIVKDAQVIATAHNEVVKRNDPTAHAEMEAIRKASAVLNSFDLSGCVLYTTGEPCPMCFSAIHWAHIDRVVYCNTKEEASAIGFDDSFITEIIQEKRATPIVFQHQPSATCKSVLRLWEEKTDKTPY